MVKIIILLFAGIYVVARWIYMHPVCLVCGLSMYPTFDDGSIILTERVSNLEIEKGEVYVFKRPTSDGKTLRVIKRVHDLEFNSEEVVAKVTKILRY